MSRPATAQTDVPAEPETAQPGGAGNGPGDEAATTTAPAAGQTPDKGPVPAAVELPIVVSDRDAPLYMTKCIGCHTIGGGGALTGPDLAPTVA